MHARFVPLLACLAAALGPDDQSPREAPAADNSLALPEPLSVEGADAANEAEMRRYAERIGGTRIAGTDVTFELLPIPGGAFAMGSPEDEPQRNESEGPRHEVRVDPFWMGRCEVTWNEFQVFQFQLDVELRKAGRAEPLPQDAHADAVSRPTPPYVPMDFEMGVDGRPAVCMTQFAAKQYTKWLSMKTGRFYRLPTEAEWEYACRAGTATAYSFGADAAALAEHAWYFDNADDRYHEVGTKKPNPWGLHDMHGNVAEWVLDRWDKGFYGAHEGVADNPVAWPTALYPRVVRGGSWDDDPDRLRSAARRASRADWKRQDPQIPKSIWYHTDARFVGVRVVRPLVPPPAEERAQYWEADVDEIRTIEAAQRAGAR